MVDDEDVAEVLTLAGGGETLTVEFKTDVNDERLVKAVVCLANAEGGTLLLGVADDGAIVGAKPRHGASTDPFRLAAMIANRTADQSGTVPLWLVIRKNGP